MSSCFFPSRTIERNIRRARRQRVTIASRYFFDMLRNNNNNNNTNIMKSETILYIYIHKRGNADVVLLSADAILHDKARLSRSFFTFSPGTTNVEITVRDFQSSCTQPTRKRLVTHRTTLVWYDFRNFLTIFNCVFDARKISIPTIRLTKSHRVFPM